MKIFKYQVASLKENPIGLHKVPMLYGAEILCTQIQDGHICVWAKVVESNDPLVPRSIEIVATGDPVGLTRRRYIGSVFYNPGNAGVLHVLEKLGT